MTCIGQIICILYLASFGEISNLNLLSLDILQSDFRNSDVDILQETSVRSGACSC
jgi:hypothetical protein